MRVTYDGPLDGVEVPALGRVVARGESVEVADPKLAASLLEQSCWSEAKAAAKPAVKKETD